MFFRRAPSLRTRIVAIVLGLLAFGLTCAAAGMFAALKDYQTQRSDDVMTAVGRQIDQIIAARPALDSGTVFGPAGNDAARLWQTGAGNGSLPSYFQLRRMDGQVVHTFALGESPELPVALPVDLTPRTPTKGNPDGEVFDQMEMEGGGPPWADPDWRIRAARLSGDRGILVMAMQTTESDELVGRIIGVEVVVTLGVLIGVGLLAFRAIKRGMRPLEEIAVTAAAIGEGDLTRRVRPADGEIGRLGVALNAMLGQIESAFREREASEGRLRRFIADASHELRTPVATIRGYAELFRRGAADRPEDLAKAMRRIESEAERMGVLVDEMLLLARLDQGRPLEREPVDLTELATDAVADARAVEPGRVLTLDANGPVVVSGDAARLRQVLGNLLANVRKHTPEDTPATVRVTVADGHAVIEVTDSGPGLTPEHLERAFERFYRGDPARSRDHGGAGLGLSIVAAVADAHGGAASAGPAPGRGAAFTVRLPL